MFLVVFLIPTNVHAQIDFEVWVESPPIFTIAKTESVNVYVKNLQAGVDDNYTVTFQTSSPQAHLISVHLPNDRTKTVKEGDVGGVLARVTLLGPMNPVSSITFRATSDFDGSFDEKQIQLITGPPMNLPEFELIGLIQLLILASLLLVISYSSHFR